jgi:hypothetical protein
MKSRASLTQSLPYFQAKPTTKVVTSVVGSTYLLCLAWLGFAFVLVSLSNGWVISIWWVMMGTIAKQSTLLLLHTHQSISPSKSHLMHNNTCSCKPTPNQIPHFTTTPPSRTLFHATRGGMSHSGLVIYLHQKVCLKAKEELWKCKYFSMQKIQSSKKSSKRNQNPSRYYY